MTKNPHDFIKIDDNTYHMIINSNTFGQHKVIVDADKVETLKQYRFTLKRYRYNRPTIKFYVVFRYNKKLTTIHQFLLIEKIEQFKMDYPNVPFSCDHQNRDTLNNKMENIRVIKKEHNTPNRISAKTSNSIYLGVCYDKKTEKYIANIGKHNNTLTILNHTDEHLCGLVYAIAAKYVHGQYSNWEDNIKLLPKKYSNQKGDIFRAMKFFVEQKLIQEKWMDENKNLIITKK